MSVCPNCGTCPYFSEEEGALPDFTKMAIKYLKKKRILREYLTGKIRPSDLFPSEVLKEIGADILFWFAEQKGVILKFKDE